MSNIQPTHEFSICLLPTSDLTNAVESLRSQLAQSPYRDDPPHITLIRGISTPSKMSDRALANQIGTLCNLSGRLPLSATVEQITNKSNQFYSESGVLLLKASAELLAYRTSIARKLTDNHYTVEPQELRHYMPHITIRLGVPLVGEQHKHASRLFAGKVIQFNTWLLFRLVVVDSKRTMHIVRPNQ